MLETEHIELVTFRDVRKAKVITTKKVVELKKAARKIDPRTAQKDLLDFAKTGSRSVLRRKKCSALSLGDEFTGGVEEVSAEMGILKNLFKETNDLDAGKAINDTGSAVNELGAQPGQ